MRVMIPVSGGLDSALMLYETLRDTDHDVVVTHYDETLYIPGYPPDLGARSRRAFRDVAWWAGEHGRAFEIDPEPELVFDGMADEFVPLRPGFRRSMNIRPWRVRAASHGANARRLGVDEVWLAHETWDRRSVTHGSHVSLAEVFARHAGPGIALRTPWIALGEDGVWRGRNRLDVLRNIPADLHHRTLLCMVDDSMDCQGLEDTGSEGRRIEHACKVCEPRRFYRAHCRPLSDEQLAVVAERIEYLAGFGRHADRADPETWHFRIIEEVLYRHPAKLVRDLDNGMAGCGI